LSQGECKQKESVARSIHLTQSQREAQPCNQALRSNTLAENPARLSHLSQVAGENQGSQGILISWLVPYRLPSYDPKDAGDDGHDDFFGALWVKVHRRATDCRDAYHCQEFVIIENFHYPAKSFRIAQSLSQFTSR